MGTLSGYPFMFRRVEEAIYDLHRLVHLATRVWVKKKDLAAKMVAKTMLHVARVFPSDEYENRDLWREYLPHALKVLESSYGEDLAERYDFVRRLESVFKRTNRQGGQAAGARGSGGSEGA